MSYNRLDSLVVRGGSFSTHAHTGYLVLYYILVAVGREHHRVYRAAVASCDFSAAHKCHN